MRGAIVLCVVLSSGCPSASPGAGVPAAAVSAPLAARPAPAGRAPPAAARPGADTTFVDALPRFRAEDGCTRTHHPSGDVAVDVAALGRVCADGLAPVLPSPRTLSLAAGATAEVPFSIEPSATCLRALAVADAPGIALTLWDGDRMLWGAVSSSSVVAVPPEGPACVRDGGTYRLVLVSSNDAGPRQAAIQLWRSARDAE